MIDIDNYKGKITFGDPELIHTIQTKKTKDLEKTKITIDFKTLVKVGLEKEVALNLIERIINLKK